MRGFESKVLTSSGQVKAGAGRVSAITMAAQSTNSAWVILDDSLDGSGTHRWRMRANGWSSQSISFPEPILFGIGIYVTLEEGETVSVSVAYE